MSSVHVLFHQDIPLAAYASSSAAMRAIHDLPASVDPDLLLVAVPIEPVLVTTRDGITAVPAGERRASGAAGPGPVTLSPNGNKKE